MDGLKEIIEMLEAILPQLKAAVGAGEADPNAEVPEATVEGEEPMPSEAEASGADAASDEGFKSRKPVMVAAIRKSLASK